MVKFGYISNAKAQRVAKTPLGLHLSSVPLQAGCISPTVTTAAFFCDYVVAENARRRARRKTDAALPTPAVPNLSRTLTPTRRNAGASRAFHDHTVTTCT